MLVSLPSSQEFLKTEVITSELILWGAATGRLLAAVDTATHVITGRPRLILRHSTDAQKGPEALRTMTAAP